MFRKYFIHCRRLSEEARRCWERVLTSISCQLPYSSPEFSRGWLENHIGKISLFGRKVNQLAYREREWCVNHYIMKVRCLYSNVFIILYFCTGRHKPFYLFYSFCDFFFFFFLDYSVWSWTCLSITMAKGICGQMWYVFQKERRLLENRRLDLDVCKARLKKAKLAEAKAAVSHFTTFLNFFAGSLFLNPSPPHPLLGHTVICGFSPKHIFHYSVNHIFSEWCNISQWISMMMKWSHHISNVLRLHSWLSCIRTSGSLKLWALPRFFL